jgi:hypothetical protein
MTDPSRRGGSSPRSPGYLVVVQAGRPDVVDLLRERLRRLPGVEVVSERRVAERRGRQLMPADPDQRRRVRRRPRPWTPLAYVIPTVHGADPIPAGTVEEVEATVRRRVEPPAR